MLEELLPNKITQKRFLSTAIARESGEMYAQKVFWHIKVPANSKGTMIESYNVERESEAEILFQKGSNLLIQNVKFDKTNNRWEMWGILQQ